MVNDFWLKNKHTISIFQAQVRDLAKHFEAQPKKHIAYKKKRVKVIMEVKIAITKRMIMKIKLNEFPYKNSINIIETL